MKKLFLVTVILLSFFTGLMAQTHTNKDGSPDKRYKENQMYKEPKAPEAPKQQQFSQPKQPKSIEQENHLKKDGTPDARYKENRPQ